MASAEPRAVPKLLVLGTAVAAAVVLLASGARTWVTGTVRDSVLANSSVSVSGREAAAGVLAAALVAAAAALAAVTGGRIVRWVGAGALTAAGALVCVLTVPVLADAAAVVGRRAATETGRTGAVDATGDPTAWAVVALVAGGVLALAGGAALVSVRRWSGLSNRYEAPTSRTVDESDWDRLSRGEDPT